jgi:hypothetical protein
MNLESKFVWRFQFGLKSDEKWRTILVECVLSCGTMERISHITLQYSERRLFETIVVEKEARISSSRDFLFQMMHAGRETWREEVTWESKA